MNFITACLEWVAKLGAGCVSHGLSYQPVKPKILCMTEEIEQESKSLDKN